MLVEEDNDKRTCCTKRNTEGIDVNELKKNCFRLRKDLMKI